MKVQSVAIIPRVPEDVFPVLADPMINLQWDREGMKSVERLSPGSMMHGSRYRGKFKGMGVVEYEFEVYDPPRSFTHLAFVPAGEMRHTLTLERVPEGTRLIQDGELKPNALGVIMSPLIKRMMKKRFREIPNLVTEYMFGQRKRAVGD